MSLAAQKSLFLVLHAVVFRYGYQKVQGRKMQVAIVSAPQECVTIHGVVTELSPVKCRKKNNTLLENSLMGRRQYGWFCLTRIEVMVTRISNVGGTN